MISSFNFKPLISSLVEERYMERESVKERGRNEEMDMMDEIVINYKIEE